MIQETELARPVKSSRTPSAWIWTALLLLCAIAAIVAVRRIVTLIQPPAVQRIPQMAALDTSFTSRKALTLSHIVPALIFVVLLPAWFSRRVRVHVAAHRRITYALFLLGAIVGITAIPLSTHPIGGLNEAAAAILYDALFLFSLARAWILFRRNDHALHRAWMMRAVAVLLGIATTRPVMGVFFATQSVTHLQPQQFFGIAFWIGFTVTYIAGEAYLRTHAVLPA
jgi:hypothetical protein